MPGMEGPAWKARHGMFRVLIVEAKRVITSPHPSRIFRSLSIAMKLNFEKAMATTNRLHSWLATLPPQRGYSQRTRDGMPGMECPAWKAHCRHCTCPHKPPKGRDVYHLSFYFKRGC